MLVGLGSTSFSNILKLIVIVVDVTIKGKEKNAQAIRVKMLDSPRFVAKKSAMKMAIS